jgi:hypothetical protein
MGDQPLDRGSDIGTADQIAVNRPRCGIATIAPKGVTRFCSGMAQRTRSISAMAATGLRTLWPLMM